MKSDANSADPSPALQPASSASIGSRQRLAAIVLLIASAGAMAMIWRSLDSGPRSTSRVGTTGPRDRVATTSIGAARDYVGSRACAECHPGESAYHADHGHSRTLKRIENSSISSWLETQTMLDPEFRSATWTYRFDPDQKAMLAFLHLGGETSSRRLDYVFGSGDHASTFVSLIGKRKGGEVLEHRMTYFARSHGLGVTPGQHLERGDAPEPLTPEGRRLSPNSARHCFGCHTTLLSDQSQATLDPATLIPTVGCEACHGPGRAHIEAARRDPFAEWSDALAMPWGSSRSAAAKPEDEMKLCGRCHRHPSMAPSGAIRRDNPELARFQPAAMMQSLCYQRGQVRCVTCHDPHAQPSRDHVEYEARCLSCHQGAGQTLCSAKPTPSSGCVDCHMPRRNAGQDILFADHWIRKPDPSLPASANAQVEPGSNLRSDANSGQTARPEPKVSRGHD